MEKTANLTVAFGEYRGIINRLVIRRGLTAQALLDRLHVPNHVLVRVKNGLVLSPDEKVYRHIRNKREELIAAEIRWPKMAKRLKTQRILKTQKPKEVSNGKIDNHLLRRKPRTKQTS